MDGNSRCTCPVRTAGTEGEGESPNISSLKGECVKAKAKAESGCMPGRWQKRMQHSQKIRGWLIRTFKVRASQAFFLHTVKDQEEIGSLKLCTID